ncbi:hypothetical protein EW146_g5411 [Bondarzewia mesenterica]|uniref:C2H2-type domain-containing protein n=1 Tax=Bondarzewia mesenterica TaxID=1095465 RepID=A0A4S4LRN1_9AGAM|nr:hypothetical protein EW146_g5411 [Bondarzewia mesenterica]
MSYDPTFQLHLPQASAASTFLETHDELLTELMLDDSFMLGFEHNDGRPTMGSSYGNRQDPSALGSQDSELILPDNWDDAVYALPQGDSFVSNIEQGQEEMWFPNTNPSSQFQRPSVDPQTFIHPENFGDLLNTSTQESSLNSIIEFTEGPLTVGFGDGVPPHDHTSSKQSMGMHPAREYRPYPEAHQQLGMPPTFYDSRGQSHPGYTSSRAYDADDVNPVALALDASYFHPPIGDNPNLYAGGTSIPMPTPVPRLPIQSPGEFYPDPSYTPSIPAPHYLPPPFQVPAISPQPAHPTGTFPREDGPVASSSRSRGRSKRKLEEVESDKVEERRPKIARKGTEIGETYLSAWRMIMEGKAVASLGLRAIRPRVERQAAAADALRRNKYVSRENIYENDNLVDVSFPNNSQVPHGGPSTAPLANRREANKMAGGATKKGRSENDEERPYRCIECGTGYRWEKDLGRHFETALAHEPASFKCDVCNKFCTRKDSLAAHRRRMHGLPSATIPSAQ